MTYELIILGSGESGTGAALLAHKLGISVFVSDFGMIPTKYKLELEQAGIAFEEGGHNEALILQAHYVVKSPGIPEKAPIVKALRQAGILIMSEIEFGFRHRNAGSKVLAITGSNGKTTTTSLTFHILKSAGYDVSVVGNIGKSYARQLAEAPSAWYVMEISSFQLDDTQTFRPDIGIIMNITPDHLDRYQYDFNLYVQAKFNLAKYQTPSDVLILCKDDAATQTYLQTHSIPSKILYFTMNEALNTDGAFMNEQAMTLQLNGEPYSISINELALKGKHNQYNSMAAGISARVAEVRNDSIRECLRNFKAIEHRMEHVASIRGVEFINDSKATNLNSVWYALESMTKPVVLILGGVDKGNNYTEIEDLVREKVKAIVCLGLDNTPIQKAFARMVPVIETDNTKACVQEAFALAQPGDCVLLSPACASFDLFKNYEDRGEQFKQAVRSL
ncbi:MAG: UDP-N-acetylmuramoyl-L-alanine--D-glutamate ligase [Chitinophagaceae bacterium]|nr:UDP-N-acetylmuramoyl-L-alanine--D-glutamate ligase [Chitinophagaceae bacterium]